MQSIRKLCVSTVAVTMAITSVPAQANQCVRNKLGSLITTNVDWYVPSDLGYTSKNGVFQIQRKKTGKPVLSQSIPSDQIACTNSNTQYTAVLSVADGKFAAELVVIAVGAVIAAISGAACAGTLGAACPAAAAAGGSIATGFAQLVLPSGANLFQIATPTSTNAYDTWGTAFKPEAGTGSCKVPPLNTKATNCGVSHTIIGG